MRRAICFAAICACLLAGFQGGSEAVEPMTPSAILQELRSFKELGTVLHVAAHPDDENTQLITYLARGRGCRMAYLSVTRGDGGQNVIGGEFGEELGVIRTQELLAARRLDGGQQFFTRAKDFGFSKDYKATLTKWNKDEVVADIVRVIRTFRPDVIATRFSTQPGGTHGHHTASAVLSLEAFPLAGDPKAFPEQLKDVTVWQPKRIVYNGGGGGGTLKLDVGGDDPVLGKSFASIAGSSRAMHKSQGFGNFGGGGGKGGGGKGGGGQSFQSFSLLRGDPAKTDIFEGIDCTWGRFPGGAEIDKLTEEVIKKFEPAQPAASLPALLEIRSRVAALAKDPLIDEKSRQLDRIVQACLGLEVETVVPQAEVVPGETLKMHHTAVAQSAVPIRWLGVRYPGSAKETGEVIELRSKQPANRDVTQVLPATTPLNQPYWLRKDGTPGMFVVEESKLIGQPENPPVYPVMHVFEVGGQKLLIPDEPKEIVTTSKGKGRRHLETIAPVSISFVNSVRLFAPGSERKVDVDVTAFRPGIGGSLQLEAPSDWKVEPASQPFKLAASGDKSRLTFKVTAPTHADKARIAANAQVDGKRYNTGRVEIRYDHIPLQLLQPVARFKAVSLDLAIRGKKVGYLPGAGDSVAESIEEMGYEVVKLTGADLKADKLKGLDAVVVGVRALNVRTDIATTWPALFTFAENGGNVIVQYNRPGLKVDKIAPYDLKIANERVTDEKATMKFLAPDHPALNTPNKITSADFDGWVQERGLYFPNPWGKEFVPLLACNDPGYASMSGSLLVAKHGKGYFVYTGLSWFRELPEGVPGAHRLFANLVSLGK